MCTSALSGKYIFLVAHECRSVHHLRGAALRLARLRFLGITVAERNVHASHHAIDGVEGLGNHAFDVSDEKAWIVGSDQLPPKGQVVKEFLTQGATETQGLIVLGRTVGFDRGSLAAT